MTTETRTKTCPKWCVAVHHDRDIHDRDIHDGSVLGIATGDRFACVALEANGHGPVRIFLDVTDAGQRLTPEEAVKVAAALTEAVRLAGVTR